MLLFHKILQKKDKRVEHFDCWKSNSYHYCDTDFNYNAQSYNEQHVKGIRAELISRLNQLVINWQQFR